MSPNKTQKVNCKAGLKTPRQNTVDDQTGKSLHSEKNVKNNSYITLQLKRNKVPDPPQYLDI